MDVGTIILNKNSNGIVKTYKIYNNNDGICLKIDTSSEAAVTQIEQEATLPAIQTQTENEIPVQQDVNQEQVQSQVKENTEINDENSNKNISNNDNFIDYNNKEYVKSFLEDVNESIIEFEEKLDNNNSELYKLELKNKRFNRTNFININELIINELKKNEETYSLIGKVKDKEPILLKSFGNNMKKSNINRGEFINSIIEQMVIIQKNISELELNESKIEEQIDDSKSTGGKRRKTYKKKEKKSIRKNKKNPTKLITPRIKKTMKK
jgi:hypothetical protein